MILRTEIHVVVVVGCRFTYKKNHNKIILKYYHKRFIYEEETTITP